MWIIFLSYLPTNSGTLFMNLLSSGNTTLVHSTQVLRHLWHGLLFNSGLNKDGMWQLKPLSCMRLWVMVLEALQLQSSLCKSPSHFEWVLFYNSLHCAVNPIACIFFPTTYVPLFCLCINMLGHRPLS